MKLKLIMFLLLSFIFLGKGILAQEEPSCGINAYVVDPDPNGLNVRSQPNVNGKVLATLKQKQNSDSDFIMVIVTGYSNGWVKIGRAENMDGEVLFDDIGWVSTKMVATGTKGTPNYDSPAPIYAANKKKKVGSIPSEAEVQIVGFSCGWVKVSHKGKSGWMRTSNICGSPVTTCS